MIAVCIVSDLVLDGSWETDLDLRKSVDIQSPETTSIVGVQVFCDGEIECRFVNAEYDESVLVKHNNVERVFVPCAQPCRLQLVGKCKVDSLVVCLVDSQDPYVFPLDIKQAIVTHLPEHGIRVAIDCSAMVSDFLDDDEFCLIGEMLFPDGKRVLIKGTSHNFFWRKHKLFCILPTGIKHRIRFKCLPEQDWSDWMAFVTRRKMTL